MTQSQDCCIPVKGEKRIGEKTLIWSLLVAAIGLSHGKRFLASLLGPRLHTGVTSNQNRRQIDMLDQAVREEGGIVDEIHIIQADVMLVLAG